MPDATPSPPPLTVPTGRYEWERLVRRVPMPRPIKLLALTLSTYADADGSRVRPGQVSLAAVLGVTERTIRRHLTVLQNELGLLELVSRGGGRGGVGNAHEYRLTVPTDLLDRVRLLSPSDRQEVSPDIQMSGQSDESPDTQVSGQSEQTPVDNSESPDIQVSHENDFHRTSDVAPERLTGHSTSIDRTSGCPTTSHYQPPKDDQPPTDLPAQLTTARDRSREDHDEVGVGVGRCGHGLVRRDRPDGTPACALCRREAKPLPRQETA